MKGIIFTEFIEFVENKFGFEMSEYIISNSDLNSKGVYTSVGTYDFQEMVKLFVTLQKKTGIALNQLLETYGNHLFYQFVIMYPEFIDRNKSFYSFVSKIDNYIHIEVKKLYYDSELPQLEVIEDNENEMIMVYKSEKKLAQFALGMLNSAAEYFNEKVEISLKYINEDGSEVQFLFKKHHD